MDRLRKQLKTDARRVLYTRRAEAAASTLLTAACIGFGIFMLFALAYAFGIRDLEKIYSLPSVPPELWVTGEVFTNPETYRSAAGVLLFLLLVSPLRAGQAYWYLENSRGRSIPAASPFHSLRIYARALYVSMYDVLLRLISFLPLLAFIWFGHLGIQAGATYFGWGGMTRRLLLLALWLIASAFVILWLWFIQRWVLLPYLAMERPELGVRDALRISRRATRGYRFELLYARFSFLGWALLSLLLLPILYAFPYYGQTMALYARYLLEQAGETREDATRRSTQTISEQQSADYTPRSI